MRIIDADKIRDVFYKAMYDCVSMDMDRCARILSACIRRIDEAPTIDIVRCKECKHYKYEWCHRLANVVKADDFCSYGEKEGDE